MTKSKDQKDKIIKRKLHPTPFELILKLKIIQSKLNPTRFRITFKLVH